MHSWRAWQVILSPSQQKSGSWWMIDQINKQSESIILHIMVSFLLTHKYLCRGKLKRMELFQYIWSMRGTPKKQFIYLKMCINSYTFILQPLCCLQVQVDPWYSCRRKNIHRAVGISSTPLFTGGWATCSCNLRIYLRVSCCGPCSPAWHLSPCVSLIIIAPSRESLAV